MLYISDEIQAGFCRSGKWFACEYGGVVRLITTAKALGGGMPIAAVTGRAEIMDAVQLAALAAPTVAARSPAPLLFAAIGIMEEQDLPAKAAHIGEVVESVLGRWSVDEVPAVAEVRGRGAMIGVSEFVKPNHGAE